jgi:hypothetical protein
MNHFETHVDRTCYNPEDNKSNQKRWLESSHERQKGRPKKGQKMHNSKEPKKEGREGFSLSSTHSFSNIESWDLIVIGGLEQISPIKQSSFQLGEQY